MVMRPSCAQELAIGALPPRIGPGVPRVFPELHDPFFELLYGHPTRAKINVEKRAPIPSAGIQQASLIQELLVEPGAGEGCQDRDLNFQKAGSVDELSDLIKDLNRVRVEPDNKAATHADAAALDLIDGVQVAMVLPGLPVDSIQSVQVGSSRTLKTDQYLAATTLVQEI
jgi:hypothetical protein